MNIDSLFQSLASTLGQSLPSIVGAIIILIAGWVVALIARAALRRGLGKIRLNERLQSTSKTTIDIERGLSTGLYYLVLLIVLVAFFNALALEQVAGSLQALVDEVLDYSPNLIAGGVILLVAWVLATIARALITRVLAATTLDEKLSQEAGIKPISDNLPNIIYWLTILLFLPAALGAFGMAGLLEPVRETVDEFLTILPNLLGAVAIGVIGWFVARLLRNIVTSLLTATDLDRLGEKAGISETIKLSGFLGLLVYILVFIPALIAAFDTLGIEAISQPAVEMLDIFLAAVPNIIAAAIILGVALVLAKFVADLTVSVLSGAGFDKLPERIGLAQAIPENTSLSALVGRIVIFFVMLFALVEAARQLGFAQFSELVTTFIAFAAQVLLGLVIISVGFWLSNLARRAVLNVSGEGAAGVANIARFAILGIVLAMGLRAMGLANEIVNLAFGLLFGAVAVAVALSFGLGGREAAGRQMEHWLSRWRGEK